MNYFPAGKQKAVFPAGNTASVTRPAGLAGHQARN